jgi:trk system potassium uptake protein TrkA
MTSKGGDEELCKLTGKKKTEIKDVMILGGGKIGFKTALDLSKNFNTKLVENLKDRAFDLAEQLPDTLLINGDGRNVSLLDEENIKEMDAFISVTGNSETNIMSCLVAKSKGVKKTIALVENIDYYELSQSIGVDTLINKKLLAANSIFRYIRKGEVVAMTKLSNMDAELLEFVVKPTSKICDEYIKEIEFPLSAIIGGIIRNGEGVIPLGDFKIVSGDRVVVCCLPQSIKKIESYFY